MSMSERKNSIIQMARDAGFHVGDQFVAAASEADLQRFADFVIADDCKELKMKTVEVSQSAIESLQKMVEQLQGERDELLFELQDVLEWAVTEKCALRPQEIKSIRSVIAKCTAKPEVLA